MKTTAVLGWTLVSLFVSQAKGLSISSIYPNVGSIAGGTEVSVWGNGFSIDSYSGSNLVFIGNIPCDVDWYRSTSFRLFCFTRPHPDAAEGESYPALQSSIISNGQFYQTTQRNDRFTYHWSYTPQVRSILPNSGPLNSIMEIGGYRFYGNLDNYERFFIGGYICDTRDPDTNTQYGIRYKWPLYYIKCRITEQQVGGWNATAIVSGVRGTSWNHTEAVYPMHDWNLAMYELHPDIHKVAPSAGGSEGGTLITVKGSGFGITPEDVTVDIAGMPCEIASHSQTEIQCRTGKPPAGSPAISTVDSNYPAVEDGFRFRGSRGVSFLSYRSISGSRLENLYSASKFPDSPDRYGVYPSFSTEDTNKRNNYGETLTAFFNPRYLGNYTFFVASDDESAVWLAQENNVTRLEKIAGSPYPSGYSNYYRYPEQRSETLELMEGEDYLLMGELKEGGGQDFIQVGVLMHETSFTASQTGQANREMQSILISTEGLYDVQTLQLAVNKTQLDPEAENPELVVTWGGRTSEPVSLLEIENDPAILRDAIFSLFEGSCNYRSAQLGPDVAVHYQGSVFSFENGVGSTDTWEAWNAAAPQIVEHESLCGRHSLYVEESRTLAFDLSPDSEDYEGLGFLVSDYPVLCLAYKLPPGHPMVIRINIRNYGWRSIPLNPGEGYSQSEVIGNFADYSSSGIVIDDDQWHYDCTNLAQLLVVGLPVVAEDSDDDFVHQILGFGFYSNPDPDKRGFYIDEVSFSDMERILNLTNYRGPARPNGIALHDVIMTTEYHWPLQDELDDSSDSEGSDWFNITVALEILPTSCEHNVPLMNITLQNEPEEGLLQFNFFRQQSASSALGGEYTIKYQEHATTTLDYDATTEEVKGALESLPSVGTVTVEYSDAPLLQDKLGTFCPGRTMTLQFDTAPGDQPLLVVDSSNLTGDGLAVEIKEELTGGLFLRPIPGHMLQTVEITPQVHVRVRGQLASCSGGSQLFEEQTLPIKDPCGYVYSPSLSPRVDSIFPTVRSAGDNIQINGAGLESDTSGVEVTFDGIECMVTSALDDMIECTLGTGFGGTKALYVHILSSGVASTEGIELQYDVAVDSVDPSRGSHAGGTEITITGIGFLAEQNNGFCTQQVLVGENECSVTSTSYTSITCITPENTEANVLYSVSVTVSCTDDPTGSSDMAVDAFTYDSLLTPVLDDVSPSEGSSSGGESITISGSGFSDALDGNSVMVGEEKCVVTASTPTTLTCVTPAHFQGSVAVSVDVQGKGRASGNTQFEFATQVDTISYCSGSLFGGQTLEFEGRRFGNDPSLVDVSVGGKSCETLDVTNTRTTCVTPSSTQTHYIDNNIEHPEYGLGYLWSPSSLTISVGDTVEWSWTGSPFATRRSVVQVDGPEDVEYNGHGFRSAVSTTGTFQRSFTTPGTYYYIAGGFSDIGFRGNITVLDLNTKTVSLTLAINSVAIDLGNAICSDTGSTFDTYSYSVDHTPIIVSVEPAASSYLDGAFYSVRGISDMPADNTFTMGGLACGHSDPDFVSTTRNSPDFRASVAGSFYEDSAFVCMIPLLEPGSYRAMLHVAGRGWAHASLDFTAFLIEPAVRGASEPQSGSIRGGLELSIFTRGLMISDVTKTRVTIGNTPCLVQRIDDDGVGTLTCIAQSARDDGYSSLVEHDLSLAYWSLQNDYFSANGSYIESDNLGTFRNMGSLGLVASASVFGEVTLGQAGISGNDITDQAAFFSASYIQVPALDEFSDPAGFGVEFWMKVTEPSTDEKYQIIVESISVRNGNNSGYVVLLNPCNELEFWLAPRIDLTTSLSMSECSLITNLTTQCSQSCSGYVVVPEASGNSMGNLPAGVWHVIRSSQSDWSEWYHILVGWEADELNEDSDCTADYVCSGTQVLYLNSNSASLAEVTYLSSPDTTIQIGGTSQLPLTSQSDDNFQLSHFSGYLDEVAFYSRPLIASQVADHYFYGSTENQPIWITVDGVDGIGTGVTPNVEYPESESAFQEEVIIEWDSVQEMEYVVDNDTAIRIEWTGLHGIRQVSRSAYESCDLEAPPLRQWSPNRRTGSVTVWLRTGEVHYLVDSVVDNCLQGKKIKVQVGQVEVIEWRVRSYEDITITEGTGLLFSWEGTHDLLELSSAVSSPRDCQDFAGPKAKDLGKLVREWQGMTSAAEVAVSGLSVGPHHFACSVPGHCPAGMRFTVTVVPEGEEEGESSDETGPTEHIVLWKIPTELYDPLTITEGEIVTFAWEGFHSLYQVTEDIYDSCDVTAEPLYEWGLPSVDNSASLSDLTPGAYYFICSVPGHCDAGMKLTVNVLPNDGLPVITFPVISKCHVAGDGHCSFAYSRDATPQLFSIQPTQSHTGTTLLLTGQGLAPSDATHSTQVWIDKTPCANVTIVMTNPAEETLQCTIQAYESGFYHVDVFVEGKGFASVSPTPLSPGPIRNATFPTNTNSPYPIFFLAATASAVVPSEGSLAGGTRVTISGTGFSQISERLTVTLGDSPCQITFSSFSEIECITGRGTSNSDHLVDVSISVNGFPASTSIQYSYALSATPVIADVSGSNLVGGDEIQISGDSFGATTSELQVQIVPPGSSYDFDFENANNMCSVTAATETTITCTVPPMAANTYQVLVHVRGLGLSQGEATVSYSLEIAGFSPNSVGHGGGILLSMSGSGFPTIPNSDTTSEEIAITICEAACRVTEATVTELNCILGPNDIASPFNTTSDCNIIISYQNIEASSADEFQFVGLLTPNLLSITPNIGGTGGGTIVNITGAGFFPPDVFDPTMLMEEDITVYIDDGVCEWFGRETLPSDTFIECRTSEHPIIREAEVRVFVRGKGYTLNTDGPILYEYIDRWSSLYTWGGGPLPQEGDSVYIQPGQTVILDISPPVLNLLLIEGALIFDDTQDLNLRAKYIFINTGKLQVGTEEEPFQHNAVITLYGSITDPEIPIYGAKVLGIRQGELDLHGRPRNVTWVRLEETAWSNTTVLHVQQPVDWVSGDKIVIAPTGRDGNETEEGEIASVSADGYYIVLTIPLSYTHHGITEVYEDGQFIEIRAEVGLLSHNVIVQGTRLEDPTGFEGLGADLYGAHILIHRMGPHPTPVRIEHTEVRFAGQAFRLGRYAIHFHLSGSMNGSYVRHCAIHHSSNRALTAHGVHDLLIEGNVAYDIMGHTYFVEDGIETNNRYLGNLGVLTRGSSSLLNTDQIPATFWITNPNNTFIGNAAAASRAYGFWYDLDDFPSGASRTGSVCPNKMPFGEFRDNVAHTCNEFGLRIWETYQPYVDGCAATERDIATLYRFTSYSNGLNGLELSVVGHVRLVGFKVADNVENGMVVTEAHGDWGGPLIKDSLIISYTNISTGEPGRAGIHTGNTDKLTISNVTFVNFNLPSTFCLHACHQCKVFQGGFQVWLEGLKFLGGSEQYKTFFQWEHEVLFKDLDGTLTGLAGGGWVTADSKLYPPQYCTKSVPEFSVNTAIPGSRCTTDVYFLRMAWNRAEPLSTLSGVDVNVTNEFGDSQVPWRHYRLTHLDGYMFTMPSGYEHRIVWLLPDERMVDTTFYSAGFYGMRESDYAWITHKFVMLPNHLDIGGNYEPTEHGEVPTVVDSTLSWHIDNETFEGTYLVTGTNLTNYHSQLFDYSYQPCPREGCPPPGYDGPLEDNYRRWSENSSWPAGHPPLEGEDVIITSRWRMLLDVTPPKLGVVYVLGELNFEDERDYNFTANLILVHGPNAQLIIGTEDSPFTHSVVITLTGRRSDSNLALTNSLSLGSKAIGIFGNVSIHGQPKSRTWTRLASSAQAGDDQITLQGNDYPNWEEGEEIVIAPSGYNPEEAEIRTIVNYDPDSGVITLNEGLEFDHLVHRFLEPLDLDTVSPEGLPDSNFWWGDGGQLAPEVGLLTHQIIIQGGEEPDEPLEFHHYGCRLLVGEYSIAGFTYTGRLQLDSVEFRFCGQGGYFSPTDPRYAIAFRNSFGSSEGSYIRRCSIHHGYSTAVGIHTSNGVEISQNVIWRTTDSSIKVGGRGNLVLDNLAMMTSTIQPNSPSDSHAVDFPATFDIDRGNTVRGNAAAGSTRLSFRFGGEPCLEGNLPPTHDDATFWDNTAHSGLIGMNVLGLPSSCTAIGGFTAAFHWNYAVFSSLASSLVATHMKIAVGKVGFNLNVFGPNPVQHLLGHKSITIADSLIVGSLPDESCETGAPAYLPGGGVSFAVNDRKLGIMMSSFNQRRSKMDGTGAWHLMKGYPVIDGVVYANNLAFARFFDAGCNYNIYAVGNNPLSPDAVHPMHMTETTLFNAEKNSLAFFYEPDVAWIVQEDCVDMDCDGPKHALVRDTDGRFVGSYPTQGSVVPFAEIRFANWSSRIPLTWLATEGYNSPAEAVQHMGVARGETGNRDSPHGGCVWVAAWQAYCCSGLQHHMLVSESMDDDTETRRLSPLALNGGDTGAGHYTDLLNGPMDHGWCTYYTCLKRLSTFFSIVAEGTDYCLWMTGSEPQNMRFHLLNADSDDAISLCIWYKNTQRKDIYKNGIFIEPENVEFLEGGGIQQLDGDFIPSREQFGGSNYFDRESQILHLVIKGSDPIEVRTAPVVQVSLNLAVSIDDFFNPGALINNLAFVLRIDPSRIRIVRIIAEDTPLRKRRSLLTVNEFNLTTITLEFGEPPALNVSTPEPPSIATEIAMAGETDDSVDLEQMEPESAPFEGSNPLNVDPPDTVEEFAVDLNVSVGAYTDSIQLYEEAVEAVEEANLLGEQVVNLLLTGEVEIENATLTSFSVVPATLPAPPVVPPIPPTYENATIDGEPVENILEEVPTVPPTESPPVESGGTDNIDYTLPSEMRVTMEPLNETGHLVHVAVSIYDASGNLVVNLGLVNSWLCQAILVHNYRDTENAPQLEGETSTPFVRGQAIFTRLRVDRPATGLMLTFRTNPSRFEVTTSVSFTVVSPPEGTPQENQVFALEGDASSLEGDFSSVVEVVREQLGAVLDVDISRLQNIMLTHSLSGLIVSVDILERAPTAPPDVPTLEETITLLEEIVNGRTTVLYINEEPFTVSSGSLPEPTVSPAPTDIPIVLIAVMACVGGLVLTAGVVVGLYCFAVVWKRGKKKKGKKGDRLSLSSEASDVPLHPIVKVNPMADISDDSDSEIILDRTTPFQSTAHLTKHTLSLHVPSTSDERSLAGEETDETSLGASSHGAGFGNIDADCWMDLPSMPQPSHPPHYHPPTSTPSHQPTTLAGLANRPFVPPQTRSAQPRVTKMFVVPAAKISRKHDLWPGNRQ